MVSNWCQNNPFAHQLYSNDQKWKISRKKLNLVCTTWVKIRKLFTANAEDKLRVLTSIGEHRKITSKPKIQNSTTIHATIKMKFGSTWDISTALIVTSRIHKTLRSKYLKVYNLSQSDIRTITSLMIKDGKLADRKIESSIYSLSNVLR